MQQEAELYDRFMADASGVPISQLGSGHWSLNFSGTPGADTYRRLHSTEHTLLSGSSMITCRCGSRQVVVTTKQIRSGDESATLFMTCATCGRTWRKNN